MFKFINLDWFLASTSIWTGLFLTWIYYEFLLSRVVGVGWVDRIEEKKTHPNSLT